MKGNSPVADESPAKFEDQLTALLKGGARQLLLQAVEAELETFLERYKDLVDLLGRRAVVRNGYLPARKIMTGISESPNPGAGPMARLPLICS
ncbi:MAG: hypothetical protein DRG69_09750 [Deltaproteobacteria bacterium]|nr:MAG: hypothetical protein DRG69_09750 [Deltaproteobacteria bacterium]